MADAPKVPQGTAWRVARVSLAYTACEYGNPADEHHDHAAECLRDDESRAADGMLRLLAAATAGDDTVALDRLTDLMGSIDRTG